MSTFLELQDEVLSHQFSDIKYREYIKQWLNEAQKYICLQTDFRGEMDTETYATVAGTATYALPADFARIVSLFNTDDANPLGDIDLRTYDDLSASSGKPTVYTVISGNLALYPTPDAAYNLELRYYKLPAEMVGAGVEPEIPSHYQHLLVRYCLIRCYQRENDYEAAEYFTSEFQHGIQKMRGEVHYDTHDSPKQVPGAFANEQRFDSSTWW